MKRKILVILSSLFLSIFFWAQEPTKDFPYYYFDKTEKSFGDYCCYLQGSKEEIEDNKEHSITMYKYKNTYYIWVKYKQGQAASEGDIKYTLKEFKDVAAHLDSRLDHKQGMNMNFCIIFTDSNNELICSAKYSEAY